MSANNGTSWTPTNTGITSNDIWAIVKKEHNLYAGTFGDGIFVSSNSGANWTLLPTSPSYVRSLETDGANIYAGTFGSGLYKSSDNGASWTQITNGISATNYVFNITSIGNSLLAASGNAYRSIDHGSSWTTFMNGIDTTCPYGVAGFYEASSYVFCGIEGGCDGSVFRINKNEVLSVNEISANKVSFSIYPNPFSNTTVLSTNKLFNNAVLTISNLYGQQIRQINNFSGQTFILHRDNLPSGLYLIQVTQDNRTIITEKLVIIDNWGSGQDSRVYLLLQNENEKVK